MFFSVIRGNSSTALHGCCENKVICMEQRHSQWSVTLHPPPHGGQAPGGPSGRSLLGATLHLLGELPSFRERPDRAREGL